MKPEYDPENPSKLDLMLQSVAKTSYESSLSGITCYVATRHVRHEGFEILGIYHTKEKAWARCEADDNGRRPSDMSWNVDSYLIT